MLLAGIKLARKLMKTDGCAHFDYEQYPGEKVQSDDELFAAKEWDNDFTSWEHAVWPASISRIVIIYARGRGIKSN